MSKSLLIFLEASSAPAVFPLFHNSAFCFFPLLLIFPIIISLFSPLLGQPLPLRHPLCSCFLLFTSSPLIFLHSLTSIHSCFLSHTLILSPALLAEDLVTSMPPKPTKARRFLLPFVFCSDSPPNGILGSHWTVSRGAYPQNCDVAEWNSWFDDCAYWITSHKDTQTVFTKPTVLRNVN